MIAEGRITIDLCRDGAIGLHSNRPAHIGRLFVGRAPQEVLEILPAIFALCARAHVAAARQAMAPADRALARADALAVLAENAREHLLRILTCWQAGTQASGFQAADFMTLVRRMQDAAGNPAAERRVATALEHLVADRVLGTAVGDFLAISSVETLHGWLRQAPTPAPRHLASLLDLGWASLGATDTQPLPDLPAAELTARLADPGFAGRPDWLGVPCETGPLVRQIAHPLVARVVAEYGAGLLARHVARLVDLAQIPDQIRNPRPLPGDADGLGVVETARGRLIHAARLSGGLVTDYHVLAPTDWNFHPRGAAVQSLRAVPETPDRAQRARAVIEAIDPCVDFEVRAA